MPDPRSVERELVQLFAETFNVDVPSVETDLVETAIVDSLILVELLAQLEEQFGVRVSLDDLHIDHFRSISTIAAFIQKGRRASADERWTIEST